MKREYKVIALDMDGTVLTDEKIIDEETKEAIHAALKAGKEVVFCTGRSYAQMREILQDFPDMHYLCGENSALIYDLVHKRPAKMASVSYEYIEKIFELVKGRDIMPLIFSGGDDYMNESQGFRLEHYEMAWLQPSLIKVGTMVPNAFEEIKKNNGNIEKICLFHTSVEEREKTMEALLKEKLPLTYAKAEISSLEITPLDMDKSKGLEFLSETLGIPVEEMIMVGDADNDLPALKKAGLAVAMGNANEHVKAIAHVQVADNNHHGCAEAIYKYLLGQE
ncbi:MAG: Cof-type HAD-IIB family hydrolase [Muricoprocola sp.]